MNFERPRSEDELASILRTAYDYACKGHYEKAIELCDWLICEPSTEIAGRRKRAAVKSHMGDIEGAILDLKFVLDTVRLEPADFHALGILLLKSGATAEAIESFSEAVKAGIVAKNDYYTDSSLLFGAEAKLKVCDYEGAAKDISDVADGFRAYIPGTGMRSKEDILAEARAAIERKSKFKFQFKA